MEQSKVGIATKGKCQQLCFATPRLRQMKSSSLFEWDLIFKSTLLKGAPTSPSLRRRPAKAKTVVDFSRNVCRNVVAGLTFCLTAPSIHRTATDNVTTLPARCSNCLSGPIMPRVQDCLSARQQLLEDDLQGEVDEGQLGGSCPAGCLPQALCPSASVAPGQDQDAEEEVEESVLFEDSAYDDEDDVDLDVDYVDYEDVNYDNVIDDSEVSEDSVASDEIIPRNSEDEISNSVPDILNEEVLTEEPESVEEVDVNIDSGFLTDSQGCHHHHYRRHYHPHLK